MSTHTTALLPIFLLISLQCVHGEWFEDLDSVYLMENNFVVAEAEECVSPNQTRWVVKSDNTFGTFTGNGYLHWSGPDMRPKNIDNCTPGDFNWDIEGCAQGDPEEWIVVPVYLPEGESGTYRIDTRGSRRKADDKEYDVWVHLFKEPPTIHMIKIAKTRAVEFSWADFGGLTEDKEVHRGFGQFDLTGPGTFYFYVAGRRENCNVDRVCVAKRLKQNPDGTPDEFNMDAHDPKTPAYKKVHISQTGKTPVTRTTPKSAPAVVRTKDKLILPPHFSSPTLTVFNARGERFHLPVESGTVLLNRSGVGAGVLFYRIDKASGSLVRK